MKRILHIIETMSVGGAEKLLAGVINGMKDYEHHLMVLNGPDEQREHISNDYRYVNLKCGSFKKVFFKTGLVKKYIRKQQIDIVHSHLYWANILARLATPSAVPLFNSIHAISSEASYNGNRLWLLLEKLTYRKRHHVVAVSQRVLHDFKTYAGIKGPATVLYNFIEKDFFARGPKKDYDFNNLKLVAVGNLRYQKNYPYLLEAFKKIGRNVHLDIYGDGKQRSELQQEIDQHGLRIRLMGLRNDLYRVLPDYDMFVMSSHFEGQPLALLEAMAAGLPALLADIPELREVTGQDALYFDIKDVDSFREQINLVLSGKIDLYRMARASFDNVNSFAHEEQYFDKLRRLYEQAGNSTRHGSLIYEQPNPVITDFRE